MVKNKTALSVFSALIVLAFFSVGAHAAGDPEAGQMKAAACGGCHGDDGNSPAATFPRLAGQYENYIVKQVMDFQRAKRTNNATMAAMAGMVATVQDAKDIGSYFASKKMKGQLTPTNKSLAAQGEKLFLNGNPRTGVYGCVNCHGKRGKGKSKTNSVFPRIGGQHRDYIIKELQDFRAGERSNDPGGMMSDIAKKLSDDEIHAVAEYLSTLL
ncbi:MAG: cytochrome c4 [Gammaproteobacteria bacterium]|nr:cytochrome c4 [Gammaproteobacteria bacterium]